MNNTCSWCGRATDVQLIEVRDDDDSELPSGTAPVCTECLEEWRKECSKLLCGMR